MASDTRRVIHISRRLVISPATTYWGRCLTLQPIIWEQIATTKRTRWQAKTRGELPQMSISYIHFVFTPTGRVKVRSNPKIGLEQHGLRDLVLGISCCNLSQDCAESITEVIRSCEVHARVTFYSLSYEYMFSQKQFKFINIWITAVM